MCGPSHRLPEGIHSTTVASYDVIVPASLASGGRGPPVVTSHTTVPVTAQPDYIKW